MKARFLILLSAGVLAAGLLLGQVGNGPFPPGGVRPPKPYDPRTPPPLLLPDAYALAVGHLEREGTSTNEFYCLSASCLDYTNVMPGWWFTFSNISGQHMDIWVGFDRSTRKVLTGVLVPRGKK